MLSAPASVDLAWQALCKSLPEGRLHRMPRNPVQRDILLAVLATRLQRRYPYSEIELNESLKGALAGLDTEVDHVTCRRYLVDCGFLRRNRPGTRYFLVFPKLESVLSPEVRASADRLLRQAREQRRRSNSAPPRTTPAPGTENP